MQSILKKIVITIDDATFTVTRNRTTQNLDIREHTLRATEECVSFRRHLELFSGTCITDRSIRNKNEASIRRIENGISDLTGIRLHIDECLAENFLAGGRQLFLARINFDEEYLVVYEVRGRNRRRRVNVDTELSVVHLWELVAESTEPSAVSENETPLREDISYVVERTYEDDEASVLSLRRELEEFIKFQETYVDESREMQIEGNEIPMDDYTFNFKNMFKYPTALAYYFSTKPDQVQKYLKGRRTTTDDINNGLQNMMSTIRNKHGDYRNRHMANDRKQNNKDFNDAIIQSLKKNKIFQAINVSLIEKVPVTMNMLLMNTTKSMMERNRLHLAAQIIKRIIADERGRQATLRMMSVILFGDGFSCLYHFVSPDQIDSDRIHIQPNNMTSSEATYCTVAEAMEKCAGEFQRKKDTLERLFDISKPIFERIKKCLVLTSDGTTNQPRIRHFGFTDISRNTTLLKSETNERRLQNACHLLKRNGVPVVIFCPFGTNETDMQNIVDLTGNGYVICTDKVEDYFLYKVHAVQVFASMLQKNQRQDSRTYALRSLLPSNRIVGENETRSNMDTCYDSFFRFAVNNLDDQEWERRIDDSNTSGFSAAVNRHINERMVEEILNSPDGYPFPFFLNINYKGNKECLVVLNKKSNEDDGDKNIIKIPASDRSFDTSEIRKKGKKNY